MSLDSLTDFSTSNIYGSTFATMVLISSAMSERVRMKMDFGWLFHLGQEGLDPNCSYASFPMNMMGVQCLGLSQVTASNISECKQACCDDVDCGTYVKLF